MVTNATVDSAIQAMPRRLPDNPAAKVERLNDKTDFPESRGAQYGLEPLRVPWLFPEPRAIATARSGFVNARHLQWQARDRGARWKGKRKI